jgi:UDP-glucose 6-dehydrogenase
MILGIVGQGFVGTALNEGLKQYFQIETYDITKASTCKSLEELSEKSDVVFVCLPTPMKMNGSCHIGIVEDTLLGLDVISKCKTVVVKSTIPPGTTEIWNKKFKNIQIVFNPEFLTEANSIEDFKNQNRIIIGGPRPATTKVKRIYTKAFPKVPIINPLIGKSHLNVPGPDGDFGYGGHCFPKDVNALRSLAWGLGCSPRMLEATDSKNNDVRTNRDWEKQEGRAVINIKKD